MNRCLHAIAAAGVLFAPLTASATTAGESDYLFRDLDVYRSYMPYSAELYRRLLTGRVWVWVNPDNKVYRNVPNAVLFDENGDVVRCIGRKRGDGTLHWVHDAPSRWKVTPSKIGAKIRLDSKQKKPRYTHLFYDPKTGNLANEIRRRDDADRLYWTRLTVGWIQDSWPRVFADGCPDVRIPAGMKINEKQTSHRLDKLRRQDPDAPLRNFAGSELTGPGQTGLGASKGRPTTTKKEVWAFLNEQEGNVLLSPEGFGRVFVRGRDGTAKHEVWGLKDDGSIAWVTRLLEVEDAQGEWLEWELDGKVVARYPMGYPLPYLPTGHRHATWQLTDVLVTDRKPVPLSWMGRAYRGHLFEFHADKRVTATGPDASVSEGTWGWTEGRLEVELAGEEPVSIAWRDLARSMGHEPWMWTKSTPNTR